MKIYYHHGFYHNDGFTSIPEQAVEISPETYHALLDGQAAGKQIVSNARGEPILIEPCPSEYHELQGEQWVLSADKQAVFLEERRQTLLKALAMKTDSLITQQLADYPQTEIESFYRQEKEAIAWRADNNAAVPMISQIAQQRGIPLAVLVEKIIEKSNQFAALAGTIIGQRQKFETQIFTAENLENLTVLEQEIEQWIN